MDARDTPPLRPWKSSPHLHTKHLLEVRAYIKAIILRCTQWEGGKEKKKEKRKVCIIAFSAACDGERRLSKSCYLANPFLLLLAIHTLRWLDNAHARQRAAHLAQQTKLENVAASNAAATRDLCHTCEKSSSSVWRYLTHTLKKKWLNLYFWSYNTISNHISLC